MKRIKVLFLIHDLGGGGAEKVLVSLVNHMSRTKFDITVISLFGGGTNEQFLAPHIHYRSIWKKTIPGNSKLMKLLTPKQLHRICVKEHYDVEISYLEGPSARVISGCMDPQTKLICWIHSNLRSKERAASSFRSYEESKQCYGRFNQIVCVAETLREIFLSLYPEIYNSTVCYNTNETDVILLQKDDPVEKSFFLEEEIKLVAVGKILKTKGFDRLAHIVKRLRNDGLPVHLYALGAGPDQDEIQRWLKENEIERYYTFLGYQTNPYKYVAKCDLFVCASLSEGFSTAATEALIVGTPVCTVEVSGMKEMLGENNEWGVITDNSEDALYMGIKKLLDDPALLGYYKQQAQERGKAFRTENTVRAVEELLIGIEK